MDEQSSQFLTRFLESLPTDERSKYHSFSSDYFCNDEENANLCAQLVYDGIKTATCSLKLSYLAEGEPIPLTGHLQVVTNWHQEPVAIIEITSVTECPYNEVTEEFAFAEGEGDRTLNWWRKAHWQFFTEECQAIGIEPQDNMMLILERFKVVYRQT